jgi:hypothetical protein
MGGKRQVGALGKLVTWAAPLVVVLVTPMPAGALELSSSVSMGGILIGTDPRLAMSASVGLKKCKG